MTNKLEQYAKAQIGLLKTISQQLNALINSEAPLSPNYRRRLAEYKRFDWDSIGAQVIASDESGAVEVEYSAHRFDRRQGNKYDGDFIIFSRPAGKNGDAQAYHTLIRFADYNAAPLDTPEPETVSQKWPRRVRPSPESPTGAPAPADEEEKEEPKTNSSPTAFWKIAVMLQETNKCTQEQCEAISKPDNGTWAEKAARLLAKYGPLPE